jgi:hypothetical protein
VFSQLKVEEEFKKFVTVRLHTDKVPARVDQVPDAEGAQQFRDVKFKNYALPYYVVVRVKGKTLEKLGFYDKGVINDSSEFIRFLESTLAVR